MQIFLSNYFFITFFIPDEFVLFFFAPSPHPSKLMPYPHGAPPTPPHPHLKIKPPYWRVKCPSRKWFLEKNKKKIIGIWDEYWCFTHKTHWTKMTKIPQERNFLTSNIQNFVSKVNEFVCKYCITWLIELANKLFDI